MRRSVAGDGLRFVNDAAMLCATTIHTSGFLVVGYIALDSFIVADPMCSAVSSDKDRLPQHQI
jgi:hypothetical protein